MKRKMIHAKVCDACELRVSVEDKFCRHCGEPTNKPPEFQPATGDLVLVSNDEVDWMPGHFHNYSHDNGEYPYIMSSDRFYSGFKYAKPHPTHLCWQSGDVPERAKDIIPVTENMYLVNSDGKWCRIVL